MIIPVRCFTCNKVIADKWNYYVKRCKEEDKTTEQQQNSTDNKDKETKLDPLHFEQNVRQKIFEELGLERVCCRRMFLGHIDLIDKI